MKILLAVFTVLFSFKSFADEVTTQKVTLPQLETSMYFTQFFWSFTAFIVFLIIAIYILIPRSQGIKDKRQSIVDESLNITQKAQRKYKEIQYKIKHEKEKNTKLINSIIEEMENKNLASINEKNAELDKSIQAQREEFNKYMQNMESEFDKNLDTNITEIIKIFAKKVINIDIEEETIKKYLNER